MTDEQFTLFETNRERADVKKSAWKKKSGAKSKRCKFPSDYLSKKEREKLNGECVSWKLDQFYTWEEFKRMPNDIKVEWLNCLLDKYQVGVVTVSKILFRQSRQTLSNHMIKRGLYKSLHTYHGGKNAIANGAKFKLVVNQWYAERYGNEATMNSDISVEEPIVETPNNSIDHAILKKDAEKLIYNPEATTPVKMFSTQTMTFSTEFISTGIDGTPDMLEHLRELFVSKKVRVKIDIEVI